MKKAIIVLLAAFLPLIFYNHAGACSLTFDMLSAISQEGEEQTQEADYGQQEGTDSEGSSDDSSSNDSASDYAGDFANLVTSDSDPGATAPVPEPATMLLLGSGLVGLATMRKKFAKNR